MKLFVNYLVQHKLGFIIIVVIRVGIIITVPTTIELKINFMLDENQTFCSVKVYSVFGGNYRKID